MLPSITANAVTMLLKASLWGGRKKRGRIIY